jgi:hypothetical protein
MSRPAAVAIVVAAVVLAAALAVVVVATTGDDGASEPAPPGSVRIERAVGGAPAPGDTAPAWSAPSLDGEGDVEWEAFLGRPIVLTIWSPACEVCGDELARLVDTMRFHPDITLVTVSTGGEGTASQDLLDAHGLAITVGLDDAAGTLRTGLGVGTLPTTSFVIADGTVLAAVEGPVDGLDAMLTALEDASPQD